MCIYLVFQEVSDSIGHPGRRDLVLSVTSICCLSQLSKSWVSSKVCPPPLNPSMRLILAQEFGFRVWDTQEEDLLHFLSFVRYRGKRGAKLCWREVFCSNQGALEEEGFPSLPEAPAVPRSHQLRPFPSHTRVPSGRESINPIWTCNPLLKGLLAVAQLSRGGSSIVLGRFAV